VISVTYRVAMSEGTIEEETPLREAAFSRRGRGFALLALALLVAALGLTACGDDDDGGPTELSFFIFNEPSGVIPKIADRCSKESNGAYEISFEYLPSEADQQREQLVRRPGPRTARSTSSAWT
jgi:hypothetical protein